MNWQTGHSTTIPNPCAPDYCTAETDSGTATITVYQFYGPNGTTPTPTDTTSLGNIVGHELGHILGLNEDTCSSGIMNRPTPASPVVTSQECDLLDTKNNVNEGGYHEPPPGCSDPQCSGCPIVLNLSIGPYQLTSAEDGVQFDIVGDGQQKLLAWTEPQSQQAFLWLDRNHNGSVDDGTELFGNHTPLRSGATATNGIEALSDYDENLDSSIDQRDSIWSDLRLWFDLNHDGISQASEIKAISQSRVRAIGLDYVRSGRRDQYGNTYRLRSSIMVELSTGLVVPRPYYDVFFVIASP